MTDTAKPWPTVAWDQRDLMDVAAAVMIQNPDVAYPWPDTVEATASYIRSIAERALDRAGDDAAHGWSVSCGGWIVCFLPCDAPHTYRALPAVHGYVAHRYAKSRNQ